MNGNRNGRFNKVRLNKTIKVAPTTRAIRAALAVSATMLALAGSGVAYAGSCSVPALNTVFCEGVFTDTVIDFSPTVDLTLILGDSAPTSVTPPSNHEGLAASWGGDMTVVSYADITTVAADGVNLFGFDSATFSNYGSILTDASLDLSAQAADVFAYGDATIINGGQLEAYSDNGFNVTAALAHSYDGNAWIDNQEGALIEASAHDGSAYGAYAYSYIGNANVDNDGSIVASSFNGSATGAYAESIGGNATVTNAGYIHAYTLYSYGTNVGGLAYSYDGNATVENSGSIEVGGYGYSSGAYAISVNGTASITNSGSIESTSIYSSAAGAYADSPYGYASVTNTESGSINVTAYNYAAGALADGKYGATIENAGSITASGYYSAGAAAYSYDGLASITNTGTGSINSSGFVAYGAYAYGFAAEVTNAGSITVDDSYVAIGIHAYGYDHATVTNAETGNIDATGYAHAVGVAVDSPNDAAAFNYGDITVLADGFGADATGIDATSVDGTVYVWNNGNITVTADESWGTSTLIYGEGATAVGINAVSGAYYNPTVTSTLLDGPNDVNVVNGPLGVVSVFANGTAVGINGTALSDGSVYIDNEGSVSATSVYARALGIVADTYGSGDAYAYNSGSVNATSYYGSAAGMVADTYGIGGNAYVSNDGSVTATGYGKAYGLGAYSEFNDAVISTGSDSVTSASAYYFAYGAYAAGYYAAGIYNAGSIYASAGSEGGDGDAWGALAVSLDFAGVYNTGLIDSSATGYFARAIGAETDSYFGAAVISNYGSIDATATGSGFATAVGATAYAPDYWAVVVNGADGSIDAHADGYYGASATGASAIGYGAAVYSDGSISAVANSDGEYGSADATGVYAAGGYIVDFSSASGSSVYAGASGHHADATGVFVAGLYNVYVDNGGDIDAFASGVDGSATGMKVLAIGNVAVYNSGDITAEFDGDYGYSTGAAVYSAYGNVYLYNGGTITASGNYNAGVYLASKYSTVLVNEGTITADYAVLTGYSEDEIWNYGTINGAVDTSRSNDVFYNADSGVWNATGASYFGAGDDEVYNNGMIHMTDAAIYLGTYSEYGNHFINNGTVKVSGDNWIDMGEGSDYVTLIPSLNPNPFYNYGVIDFQDGHPDDTLTIVGDFAGDGDISVDVSAIHKTSDLLYIDGSVVDGTSMINPDVLDTPTSEFTEIPMVYVTGNSGAGNFALGDVGMDLVHTFLTFDFNLVSHVDTTNATDDRYALTIDVTGLSDPGVLAASVVPGVQSLANEQVGTWRQRMGVINKFQDSTFAMWARWFQNDGTITPDHVAGNFGQGGNFDFDQKNSGFEVGADFSVNEEFSFGVLGGQADADQDLNAPGSGSTKIDADTYGVYATWLSNGFYVDGSYRWMNFTADSTSAAGVTTVKGDAETFNIEAGYAWTLEGGLQIEPQAQYTNTNVSNVDAVTLGQTAFQAADGTSEVGRLGVSFRKGYGDPDNGTLWTPYATLSAVWEMDGENAYTINGSNFAGHTSTDGSSGLLELGLTAQTGNLSVFGGINWQDGGALDSFVGGQLGVRYTFGHAAPAPAPVVAPPAKTCADLDDDGDGVNNCNDKCPGSAAGQAIGPDGCPVPLTIDLKGVNFDFDKDTLRPDAVAILDEAISILGKYPELKVEVAGHTDSKGTDEYNQKLSERRAKAVYDYLAAHAIGTERMVGPVGYGESKPIAPNTNEDGSDNPDGRAKNRRTELNVQN